MLAKCYLLFIFLISTLSFANNDFEFPLTKISLETKTDSIDIELDIETYKIKYIIITIDGVKTSIDKKLFIDIPSPQLNTLKYTGGCDLERKPIVCYSYLSIEYRLDVDFDVYPDWYKEPKVTFVFMEDKYEERIQRIPISKDYTKLIFINIDGTIKEGGISNRGSYK